LQTAGDGAVERTRSVNILSLPSPESTLQSDASLLFLDPGYEAEEFTSDHGSSSDRPLLLPVSATTCIPNMDTSTLYVPTDYYEVPSQSSGITPHKSADTFTIKEPLPADTVTRTENGDPNASTPSKLEIFVDSLLLSYYYSQLVPQNQAFSNLEDIENTRDSSNISIDGILNQTPGVNAIVSAVSNFMNSGQFKPSVRLPLPDPYSNSIYCIQTSTLLPYIHNARCIGLNIEDLLARRSPFYRTDTTMEDNAECLLAAARKPWIPAHLQPILPQILFPHHPYLDLLPFPELRERAITLAALFNPMELKRDIFREGLACYRVPRDRKLLVSVQPWDRRSWEVKPWFWKKWRLLMDTTAMDGGKEIHDMGGLNTVIGAI
jgi:Domain of unknown function (DUF3425)